MHTESLLPIEPGKYITRNGRVAVVVEAKGSVAGGYLESRKPASKHATCWYTKTGQAYGTPDHGCWDLVARVDESK